MKFAGFDVSYGRTSETVGAAWEVDDAGIARLYKVSVEELHDIKEVVAFVEGFMEEEECEEGAVDGIGFGQGAVQLLGYGPYADRIQAYMANERPARFWEKAADCSEGRNCSCDACIANRSFVNLKTRVIWEMRKAAYQGKVKVLPDERLVAELQKYKLTKVGNKWKTEDPKPSPDVADAAVAGYYIIGVATPQFWVGS